MGDYGSDVAGEMCGVQGRWTHRTTKPGQAPGLWFMQRFIASRPIAGYGAGARITVKLRFDDELGNQYNTFSVTGDVVVPSGRKRDGYYETTTVVCNCLHDDIAKVFPELAHLIPWHLCASDGPTHYVANTVYHAGDKDHNGLRKGEVRQLRNRKTGKPSWKLAVVDATGGEVSPEKYLNADECPPAPATLQYVPWVRVGEGKARDLAAARSCALWPEATDAELCAEPDALRAVLTARLPALLARFRTDLENAGFMMEPVATLVRA